jgi:hypothetical protein
MANYAVTDHLTVVDDPVTVMAALETYLETVDDSKTIHLLQVIQLGSAGFQGLVIHGA